MIKRGFKKFYTREMPLFNIEYWYEGEVHGLEKVTGGAVSLHPLFVYQKSGLTDVYYDVDELKKTEAGILSYFSTKPQEFYRLAKRYERDSAVIENLIHKKEGQFVELFNLTAGIWPVIAITVVLGELAGANESSRVANKASELRAKYGEIEYKAAEMLIVLAEKMYPRLGDLTELLTFQEIKSGKLPTDAELRDRSEGFIYLGGRLYPNYPLTRFAEKHGIKIIKDDRQTTGELKGRIASKGRISGRVRVILTADTVGKFKKGEVLVSTMTTPDFLPAMRRAAAFVTDEGGITSHAAIVSRELNIPCIVGTRVATKVLKTGDLVEVDAEKEIVRKLQDAG